MNPTVYVINFHTRPVALVTDENVWVVATSIADAVRVANDAYPDSEVKGVNALTCDLYISAAVLDKIEK